MIHGIEEKLNRLVRLTGSDEGFYILALHSFIEYYLRIEKGYGDFIKFHELTWKFRNELIDRYGDDVFIPGLGSLGQLGHQHGLTNQVRHSFEYMDAQEAAAATSLFITFCTLTGIDGMPQVGKLSDSLSLWKERLSHVEQAEMIRKMQTEIKILRDRNKTLLEQKKVYESLKARVSELSVEIKQYELQAGKESKTSAGRKERIDALRHERNELNRERNRLLSRLEEYGDLKTYIQYLGRLSVYTRSRMDYEHTLAHLTPEQETTVKAITMKKDFLVRGGAGTGKSLILIERLKRLKDQEELDFGENESIVFVTFTRTLTKYNRYIGQLMGIQFPLEVFGTVYGLIQKKLETIVNGFTFDWNILETYFTENRTPDFFSPEEMVSELENFIFANAVSRDEYLVRLIPRKGMKRRLSRQQRETVWKMKEEAVEYMRGRNAFSRNYGCVMLLEYLRSNRDDKALRDIRHLFLDEVQDVIPTALTCLKELTRGSMIMAGDTEQSLYTIESPFVRAKIRISGFTRFLRTNFRNTLQIMELAREFKDKNPYKNELSGKTPAAFREGPFPELFIGKNSQELQHLLTEKIDLFTRDLGYEPETVCVLAPRTKDIETLEALLESHAYSTARVKDDAFSFTRQGSIRLSTLHSSKGLDFPVVLLYLPSLHRRNDYAREEMEKILRNLVYVGLTRGMDHVNVFTIDSGDPVIRDLIDSFTTAEATPS